MEHRVLLRVAGETSVDSSDAAVLIGHAEDLSAIDVIVREPGHEFDAQGDLAIGLERVRVPSAITFGEPGVLESADEPQRAPATDGRDPELGDLRRLCDDLYVRRLVGGARGEQNGE